jgi:ABC-2 type transport system ATP-binding protein
MSTLALRMSNVTKRYGKTVALAGFDLEVPRGVICGLVGPNGAGKTTTFGIVGGFIQPQGGEIDVLGQGPFRAHLHRGEVTLLPQDCELNPHTAVVDLLRYYARLQGLTRAQAQRAAERALAEVALADRARDRLRQLSHGMRRRVQVAQALLGQPALVLLDEPTSGLDPELVVRMRQLFAEQRGRSTLVISSHNLAELEAVCDHVVFIRQGRCVGAGSMAEVTRRGLSVRYLLQAPLDIAPLEAHLPTLAFRWEDHTLHVTAPKEWSPAEINAQVIPLIWKAGGQLLEVRQGQSLEDAYMAGAGVGGA